MIFEDLNKRKIRLSKERIVHFENDHPEMKDQLNRIKEVLSTPDTIVLSSTEESIEIFYKFYEITPVTRKYLCVLVKTTNVDSFIITSYFTNAIKKGKILWKKK